MNSIIDKYQSIEIISLGPNCGVKLFLNQYGNDVLTHFFDYIGNMAAMLPDIIQSQPIVLEDEYYPENDDNAIIYSWKNNTRVHKKYLLSIPHYSTAEYTNEQLTLLLNRRILKFYDSVLYNTHKFKIFIYFEDNHVRHFNPKYNDQIKKKCVCDCTDINQYVYQQTNFQVKIIQKLANDMKKMFPCPFIIIYISNYLSTDFEYNNNVVHIKSTTYYDDSTWEYWDETINNTLNKYEHEIINLIPNAYL